MSAANVTAFLGLLGDQPTLLDELKVKSKDEVIAAAGRLGLPFTAADFERIVWDLEGRLAEHRGEGFDAHFPLWQTMWGRFYLEALALDLIPGLSEAGIPVS